MLRSGDPAPSFYLPDADMNMRSLSDFSDRKLVLYFYPRNNTTGCTIQATDFSELYDEYEKAGAHIVGVSRDDCFSHQTFRDKYGLKFTLLDDVEGEACRSYGVLEDKEIKGEIKTRLIRSTFIIDMDGIIRHAEYGVSPCAHAHRILEIVTQR